MKKRTLLLVLLATFLVMTGFSSCLMLDFDESGTLLVDNQSDETIYFLYISRSSSNSWGDDVLGNEVINPGEAYYLTVRPGFYDVQVADFFNIELDSIFDQQVFAGETTIITYY